MLRVKHEKLSNGWCFHDIGIGKPSDAVYEHIDNRRDYPEKHPDEHGIYRFLPMHLRKKRNDERIRPDHEEIERRAVDDTVLIADTVGKHRLFKRAHNPDKQGKYQDGIEVILLFFLKIDDPPNPVLRTHYNSFPDCFITVRYYITCPIFAALSGLDIPFPSFSHPTDQAGDK